MLETVAYHDPIVYHRLKRCVGERLNQEYSTERHREALDNLKELGFITRGGLGHEYVHISPEGWARLGGETPRHDPQVETQYHPNCEVCGTDEFVEANW